MVIPLPATLAEEDALEVGGTKSAKEGTSDEGIEFYFPQRLPTSVGALEPRSDK